MSTRDEVREPANLGSRIEDGDGLVWVKYANGEWARLSNDPRYDPWVRSWEGVVTEYGVKRVIDDSAAAKRDTLNEAADAWQQGQWADAPRRPDRVQERIANAQFVTEWLRERARALVGDETPGTGERA